MAIISDVNGKVAILRSGMFDTYQCRFSRKKSRHRIKFIGAVLTGKKLYNDMRKAGNFHELTESIRWTSNN